VRQAIVASDEFDERMTAARDAADSNLREARRIQRRPPPRALPALGKRMAGSADAGGSAEQRAQRDSAMPSAYATGHHTRRSIADAFGAHDATVSRALLRVPDLGRRQEAS